jgi:chemotaxis protein MotB
LPQDRVLRVQGLASSSLFDLKDPASPANRRISIIVMNRDAEDRFFGKTTDAAEPGDEKPAIDIALPSISPVISR